ncbi:CARDB domain-containing protein [Haloarchaeobius salinus]|uniref:CARDB domain-containing protein n=1 Tax=Haloarchaeobius salinus TaxID=1198298 RepID=UPI00210C0E74|nr:CARDB domain-containing protein [Haloarchaeobius salinus]
MVLLAAAVVGGATTPPPDTYAVVQGDRCVAVAPVTGGQSVESAYDYRTPFPNQTGNPSASDYSAHGFRQYQASRTTTMLFYSGPQGDSLVTLNGELDNADEGGSTATFEFQNLPQSGSWAVQDDDYPDRDDDWTVGTTETTVDWMWGPERTDGGAFRGIASATEPIVVRPAFNERATAWGEWEHSGTADHRVQRWRLVDDGGQTVTLDMTEPILVAPGSCADFSLPAPSVGATPDDVPRNRPVTLSATADGVVPATSYRWDLDGDGTVDRVTETATTEVSYASAGTYTASVVAASAVGTSDPASVTVRVGQSDEPAIGVRDVSVESAVAGEPTPVRVDLVNDGGGEGSIQVDVVADDDRVGSREVSVSALSNESVTVNATFPEEGEYTVEVGSARTEVSVAEAQPELAVSDVAVDDPVPVDEPFTITASVENVGNAAAEFDVRLQLFGEVVESREVALDDGERRAVEFDVTVSAPGSYTARVGDRTAEFDVRDSGEATASPTTTPGGAGTGSTPGYGLLAGIFALAAVLVHLLHRASG